MATAGTSAFPRCFLPHDAHWKKKREENSVRHWPMAPQSVPLVTQKPYGKR